MPPADRHVSMASMRVRFAETDMMGIVHHAAYIVYFEEGRSHFSREVGAPYADLEEMGYSFAVAEVNARYAAPAVYDQLITVCCWVEKMGSRGMTFGYEILDPRDALLVSGYTRHICVNRAGEVQRIPAPWLAKLTAGLAAAGGSNTI